MDQADLHVLPGRLLHRRSANQVPRILALERSVPKTIAVLASLDATKHLDQTLVGSSSHNLCSFARSVTFYPFDVCYPSLALARCVNQLELRKSFQNEPTEAEVFKAARGCVSELLRNSGVQYSKTRQVPLWRVLARVEGKQDLSRVKAGFEFLLKRKTKDSLDHLPMTSRRVPPLDVGR